MFKAINLFRIYLMLLESKKKINHFFIYLILTFLFTRVYDIFPNISPEFFFFSFRKKRTVISFRCFNFLFVSRSLFLQRGSCLLSSFLDIPGVVTLGLFIDKVTTWKPYKKTVSPIIKRAKLLCQLLGRRDLNYWQK